MSYGMYIAAEGAQAQSRRLEVLANNLANVDTPGFKINLAVLQARPSQAIKEGKATAGTGSINDVGGGVRVGGTPTSFSQGALQYTGSPTDVAITGEGFFVVDHDGKQMLTRAGNFLLSNEGKLITPNGDHVLSADGAPITVNNTSPWKIQDDGVLAQAGTRTPLGLAKPASLGDLVKVGENLFSPLSQVIPIRESERHVRNGYIEKSNARPTSQMMQLIEASRAFEANVRMIQNQDQVISSLVNRVLKN